MHLANIQYFFKGKNSHNWPICVQVNNTFKNPKNIDDVCYEAPLPRQLNLKNIITNWSLDGAWFNKDMFWNITCPQTIPRTCSNVISDILSFHWKSLSSNLCTQLFKCLELHGMFSLTHGDFDNILQEVEHTKEIQTNFPLHLDSIVNWSSHQYHSFLNRTQQIW